MKQEQLAKILKAVAILLLCFLFPLRAGANDDFIRGYASAVLEREFQIKKFSLEVAGETVRIKSAELANADHDKLMATLLSIQGVKQVAILDSRGVVVASSTPRQAATQRASRQEPVPEYELGFLPGGNLFESLVADPRWPRFSMGYRYFTDEARNVASATHQALGDTSWYGTANPLEILGRVNSLCRGSGPAKPARKQMEYGDLRPRRPSV
jgi:hypothetical protein